MTERRGRPERWTPVRFGPLPRGKSAHHGHGLTPAGKKVFDKQLPNSEPKLRAVIGKLAAEFGTVLVIVDQPASIGALPLTVARDAGCKVAYLSGLAMRRIADLYPGEAKTDAKDAAVIADAARTLPHALRSLELSDEITAELTVLVGFDQDLAAEATRTSKPDTRPAHPVPPQPGTRPGPTPGPPGRHLAAGMLRLPGRLAESRPPQARGGDPAQSPAHGPAADRRGLHRAGRADRRGARDRHPRCRDPLPGQLHVAPGDQLHA